MTTFEPKPGLPSAVFRDKFSRVRATGGLQTYGERINEVVRGNLLLSPRLAPAEGERLLELALGGIMAFSGRHLQHGDDRQPEKVMEFFTNCATAPFSFIKFWLLLKGCGVGRSYDDSLCLVDWRFVPHTRLLLDSSHSDFHAGIEPLEVAREELRSRSDVSWFKVADSAEGWAKVVELLESAAWRRDMATSTLAFDFSGVRAAGSPISGQQGRGSSGPAALIAALRAIASLKHEHLPRWKQAMLVDHHLARCVLAGGARRSARIATKTWKDPDIFDFIGLKEAAQLETANHSVAVDAEFWTDARRSGTRAHAVFKAIAGALYHHGCGEPGFINIDQLTWNDAGLDSITPERYLSDHGRALLTPTATTDQMIAEMLDALSSMKHPVLTNPCGEIVLSAGGGYCVVGDVCLANVESQVDAIDAVRLMVRFLIRVNRMPCLFEAEVRRTNRIGVSLTGMHELAHRMFGLSFRELCDEKESRTFWTFLSTLRTTAETEAADYARELGMVAPHTVTTIKPSGTISKLMSCTEGAHLPALDYHLRWVQYPADDPRIHQFEASGYPTQRFSSGALADRVIVGFPSRLPLVDELGSQLMVAADAPMDLQYRWLRLLERHWLGGAGRNNQVSYTLKYDPELLRYDEFEGLLLANQPTVRSCALMPSRLSTPHAYLPEERISRSEYDRLVGGITPAAHEGYSEDSVECSSGACSIEPTCFDGVPTVVDGAA